MPFTKCGTAFERNAPPKKYAMQWYQRMVRAGGHPSLRPRSASADRLRRVELAEEDRGRHAGDGAELGDEMGLVVVAGAGGDARPARGAFAPGGAHRATEARELGERLWTHADGFTEDATKVSLAHAEVDRD